MNVTVTVPGSVKCELVHSCPRTHPRPPTHPDHRVTIVESQPGQQTTMVTVMAARVVSVEQLQHVHPLPRPDVELLGRSLWMIVHAVQTLPPVGEPFSSQSSIGASHHLRPLTNGLKSCNKSHSLKPETTNKGKDKRCGISK